MLLDNIQIGKRSLRLKDRKLLKVILKNKGINWPKKDNYITDLKGTINFQIETFLNCKIEANWLTTRRKEG